MLVYSKSSERRGDVDEMSDRLLSKLPILPERRRPEMNGV